MVKGNQLRSFAVAGAMCALVVASARAAGSADLSFDGDGIATTDLGGDDLATGVAVQPDGKIVVTGATTPSVGVSSYDFSVARYLESGALDPGFASGGKLRYVPKPGFGAQAIALEPDGKIVLAGVGFVAAPRQLDAVVARLNADGSIDAAFGDGGSIGVDYANGRDFAQAITIQPDGKIIVGGDATDNARHDEDFALARLTTNGQLDPSFGAGGRVRTDFPGGSAAVQALAVQPDGKILAAGGSGYTFNTVCSPTCSMTLARYNADGSLDASFGGGGQLAQRFASSAAGNTIALQRDGKILVGAPGRIARFMPDGALDQAFGAGGSVEKGATALFLDPVGRILVAGSVFAGTPGADLTVTRLLPNGAPDPRFGTPSLDGGTQTNDYAAGAAVDAKGRIVVAGTTGRVDGPHDFVVARFLPPQCLVPNLRKATITVARSKLLAAGCATGQVTNVRSKVKKGSVIAQSVKPGAQLPDGASVNLTVSKGPRR